MQKKFMIALSTVVLVLVLSSAVFAQDTFKVGYACNNFNDTFQTFIEDHARAYAEKEGVEFVYSDGGEDILKQQDQINAFIAEGVDALIVVPIDTSAVEPIMPVGQDHGNAQQRAGEDSRGDDLPPAESAHRREIGRASCRERV